MIKLITPLLALLLLLGTAYGKKRFVKRAVSPKGSLIEAKKWIQKKKYNRVAPLLAPLIKKKKLPPEAEEAFVLLVEAYLRRSQTLKASDALKSFYKKFPDSPYQPRMKHYQGVLYLKQGRNYKAAQSFVKVINQPTSKSLFNQSKNYLLEVVKNNGLHHSELKKIVSHLKFDEELVSHLLFVLGDLQAEDMQYREAYASYKKWRDAFSDRPEDGAVKTKLKLMKKQMSETKTILILVPITGAYAEIGKMISEGIILRLEKYFKKSHSGLKYKIVDTQGEPIATVQKVREILKEKKNDVVGVLGPVMSDVTTALAIELSNSHPHIPLITPTATTHGISQLGKNIFQLNVTTQALGQLVAKHSVDCLKLKEFAILAPNTQYGLELSRSFEEEVTQRGARIIAKQFYNPEESDFSGHFKVIRMRKVKEDLLKSGGRSGRNHLNSRTLPSYAKDSILKIDGLFIPASNGKEAHLLSNQAQYHKLKTTLLGSSGWYDKDLFSAGFRHSKGAIFSTDFLNLTTDAKRSFDQKYKERWGASPDKIAVLGYDATSFIVEALRYQKPSKILEGLLKIKSFHGVYNKVFINQQFGYNESATLLKVGRKDFESVQGCGEGDLSE